MNLLLVRLGYAPAIVYKRDRSRYLRALRAADDGDPGALGERCARQYLPLPCDRQECMALQIGQRRKRPGVARVGVDRG